jgi:V/A-type H+/Na+-transporting ATPase subunit I
MPSRHCRPCAICRICARSVVRSVTRRASICPGPSQAVLENQQRLRDTSDRRDALVERIAELEPWGDFTLPPEQDLAGRKFWFYIVPQRQMAQLATLELPWQVVHRDNRQSWVVVIHPDEPPRDALPVPRTLAGALSLSEVRRRLEAAELELEEIQAEHVALTRWIYLISTHLAQAEDAAQLRHAQAQTRDEESLFLVQGWAPEDAVAPVQALAEQQGLALLMEAPGPDDAPPTLLDNPGPIAAGQDLVAFYQMPAYDSWDPSRVLFFSFAAFFAMILSDAGYAASWVSCCWPIGARSAAASSAGACASWPRRWSGHPWSGVSWSAAISVSRPGRTASRDICICSISTISRS